MKKQKPNNLLARIATEVEMKHIAIIAGCAVLLLLVLGVRGEINFNPFKAKAASKSLTYEEALRQAESEIANGKIDFEKMNAQLGMVDPNKVDKGQVLGMTTNLGIADPIDKIFSPQMLNQIKLITINDNSTEAIKKYSQQVALTEVKYNFLKIIIILNSNNAEQLATVPEQLHSMIGEMKGIEVPAELIEQHKLKILYYEVLAQMAQTNAGIGQHKIDDLANILLSIMDRLGAIKAEIYSKHNIVI